jgi:hypothetical protein
MYIIMCSATAVAANEGAEIMVGTG